MIQRFCLICCLALIAAACTSSRVANWDPDDYTVRSGDTIYSIAWKYELDPFEFARWNHIASPYLIRPGQRLHTREIDADTSAGAVEPTDPADEYTPPPVKPVVKKSRPAPASITVRDGDTLYRLARRYHIPVSELVRINQLKSPYLLKPGQTLSLKSRPAPKSPAVTPVTKVATVPAIRPGKKAVSTTNRKVKWSWPVKGRVVNRFNHRRSDSKGIDIAGRAGSPVLAAAPGKVVYSGNGLISYGNLVIIKHNRSYLSAYAYNRKLLVREGESVKAGQKIAELGRSGSDSPRLHFEIRKNGKPVNPLSYLPSS